MVLSAPHFYRETTLKVRLKCDIEVTCFIYFLDEVHIISILLTLTCCSLNFYLRISRTQLAHLNGAMLLQEYYTFMKPIVFTLVGQDKPGLISDLAHTVYAMGGNWLGSNLSHMAGHFAGFVQVDLPQEQHAQLIDTFANHPHLKIHVLTGAHQDDDKGTQIKIEITGNDRPGIVQELTQVLSQGQLNIIKFDSSCQSAPNWGSLLFNATAVISVLPDFDQEQLRSDLESLANDLMIDITPM